MEHALVDNRKEAKPEESLGGPGRADREVGTPSSERPASNTHVVQSPKGANRHCVLRGETLWEIARAYYGSSTAATVEAIYQANRETLKGPHELKEGLELVMPDLPVARLASDKVPPKEPTAAKKPPIPEKGTTDPKKQDKKWKWYEVSHGDRYTTIAQKELGDSKEWKQLFELNKDIFPDPARLRPGVRIRIPLHEKASGRQG